jgi:hypothetical protein
MFAQLAGANVEFEHSEANHANECFHRRIADKSITYNFLLIRALSDD